MWETEVVGRRLLWWSEVTCERESLVKDGWEDLGKLRRRVGGKRGNHSWRLDNKAAVQKLPFAVQLIYSNNHRSNPTEYNIRRYRDYIILKFEIQENKKNK